MNKTIILLISIMICCIFFMSCEKKTITDETLSVTVVPASEYQTVAPFSIEDNLSYFLKSDGIVLNMPAVHATDAITSKPSLNTMTYSSFIYSNRIIGEIKNYKTESIKKK